MEVMMPISSGATDWVGLGITFLILTFIILIVWSRIQGDTIIDILRDIRDFMKEGRD